MGAATLVSLEEYLATRYQPDCDYVDGEVLERNVGEREHSFIQQRLMKKFFDLIDSGVEISIWPEVRIQVSATRFRVPDICLYWKRGPRESVFREAPFVAVEILSPEDRMSRMEEKLEDYFRFGVDCVWVIDPLRRSAYIHTGEASRAVRDGVLLDRSGRIRIEIEDLFAGMDE